MKPSPYLFFDGQCGEAIDTYADILGAEILDRMPASNMPPEYPVPEEKKDWVMHSRLKVGEGEIMASDNLFGEVPDMAGAAVMLSYETAAEGKAVYDKLADGGNVEMEWAPTFWCAGFGTLTDRFGVKWMIGCDEPPA